MNGPNSFCDGNFTKNIYLNIESIIQRDEGGRGIKSLCIPYELESSARILLSCSKVVIITGFPCMLDFDPPTETDGPLGKQKRNLNKYILYASRPFI